MFILFWVEPSHGPTELDCLSLGTYEIFEWIIILALKIKSIDKLSDFY